MLLGFRETAPPLSGLQSDSLGRSLVALLKRDPRRFTEVAARLAGRQLPEGLRAYMWTDVLLREERIQLSEG